MYGERIKELRMQLGLSQTDLAKRINVSSKAIKNWEMDSACPSSENMAHLAKVFGVSTDFLLGLTDRDPIFLDDLPDAERLRIKGHDSDV